MYPRLTAHTRLYALVGDPLQTAKSPLLFNTLFSDVQTDAVCIPLEVSASAFADCLHGLRGVNNLAGLLITMPHKRAVVSMVDQLHPSARQVGAVNVIRCTADGQWEGAVFDGLGCVLGIEREGVSLQGKSVLLVGAGGAGSAIAFAVAAAGARTLVIANRDHARAVELAQSVAEEGLCQVTAGIADAAGYDVVINATSLGMNATDPLPVDVRNLSGSTVVVDIVTRPEPTALRREALARGCKTLDSQPMHIGQALLTMNFLGLEHLERRYAATL